MDIHEYQGKAVLREFGVPTLRGVPAVARTPYHASAANPGKPCSATVGTSGNAGERFGPVVAMACKRPARMCAVTADMPMIASGI